MNAEFLSQDRWWQIEELTLRTDVYEIHLTAYNVTQVEEALIETIHDIPVLRFCYKYLPHKYIHLSFCYTPKKHFKILFKHSLNVCCVHHSFHYVRITSSAQLQDKNIVLKLFAPWLP